MCIFLYTLFLPLPPPFYTYSRIHDSALCFFHFLYHGDFFSYPGKGSFLSFSELHGIRLYGNITVYLTSPLLMDKMGQSFTMTSYCNEDLCEYVFIFLDGIIVINVQNRDCWVKECVHLFFCQLLLNWVCNFTFPLVASESVSLLAQQCYILSNF